MSLHNVTCIALAMLMTSGCANNAKDYYVKLDETKPLQIIQLNEFSALPAQNDKAIEDADLAEKLAKLNPDFQRKVESKQSYERWGLAGLFTQIILLGACLGQRETQEKLAWCAGSIAAGALTFPLVRKAGRKKLELMQDYNRRFDAQK